MGQSKYLIPLLCSLLIISGCNRQPESGFEIKADRVLEGPFTARALSPREMVSDYSIHNTEIQQPILFKLSLNGQDNEGGFGADHLLVVPEGIHQFYAPLLQFGRHMPAPIGEPPPLTATTTVHFRVDLRPEMRAFTEQGFVVTPTGDTVHADTFKGLYLAGNTPPLKWIWDLDQPPENSRFTDADGDSIFDLAVTFEPPGLHSTERRWTLRQDIDHLPRFHAPEAPLLEALYNLALDEAQLNIRSDSCFDTGAEWPGVWTRDVSYASHLSLAYFFPEIVKNSLRRKLTSEGRIIQDTGTGGSWPVSSDRFVWILAAWEVYLATGDKAWLQEIRGPVIRSLQEDIVWNRDPLSGLLRGETSFEDWREQTYPRWLTPAGIHASLSLSTNLIFKRALEIGSVIAPPGSNLAREGARMANALEEAILSSFRHPKTGHLASYILSTPSWIHAEHRDALGEALAVLFTDTSPALLQTAVNGYPRSPIGTPVIYPQLPHSPPYHNQGIWPFVEAYSLLAAKQTGSMDAVAHSFKGLTRAAALNLTHKENYHWLTGETDVMAVNSDRQLWSIAGYLGAILKGLMGIQIAYEPDTRDYACSFAPCNPWHWDQFSLEGLTLQGAKLDLHLSGRGDSLVSLRVNDVDTPVGTPLVLSPDFHYQVEMEVTQRIRSADNPLIIVDEDSFLPLEPIQQWEGDTLYWQAATPRVVLLRNGRDIDTLKLSPVVIPDSLGGFFSLQSLDSSQIRSLPTEPVYRGPAANLILKNDVPYFVELGKENDYLKLSFESDLPGSYLIRFRYANGSGPISTDNKCGLAKLSVSDWWLEQMIAFPQTGSWDHWHMTGWYPIELSKGTNTLRLEQGTLPVTNMDGAVNTFRVSVVELIPERLD